MAGGKVSKAPGVIEVTCRGADVVALERLEEFQGGLKALRPEEQLKLETSLQRYGFTAPVFVWERPKDKRLCIIDGHQRIRSLRSLLEKGWTCPKVPVAYISAKSEREAKEKLLVVLSQHGRLQEQGIFDFVKDAKIDWEQVVATIALPEISMTKIERLFFGNSKDFTEVLDVPFSDNPDGAKRIIIVYETSAQKKKLEKALHTELRETVVIYHVKELGI